MGAVELAADIMSAEPYCERSYLVLSQPEGDERHLTQDPQSDRHRDRDENRQPSIV